MKKNGKQYINMTYWDVSTESFCIPQIHILKPNLSQGGIYR
jgi:hypothetical protein